jgi:cytochrome P450
MSDGIVVLPFDQLDPPLRAMVMYEQNGSFDIAEPRSLFAEMLAKTPIVQWDFGVAFFTVKDILAAARNPAIVSSDPITGLSMGMGSRDQLIPLHVDGERHAAYRRLLEPLLSPSGLAVWETAVRALADELIDSFVGAGQVEVMSAFARPLPGQIFLRIFGLPQEDLPLLVSLKDRILKGESADLQAREELGKVAGDELRAHLRIRLEEHRALPPRDDLISQFTAFEVNRQRLSDDEIVNVMHMFTVAGLDTVTASLSLILAWLAEHPEHQRQLREDPGLLPTAIEELMRVVTPVPTGGLRWAAEDTVVNDVPVAKGSMVFLGWGTANVDPEAFADPLKVDLARRPNRHLAFAAGTHRCVGAHLARLELKAAIDQLHKRMGEYRIAEGNEPEYQLAGVRQCRTLPLTFAPSTT